METISYSQFRNHLADILDKVNDNHKPVLITRTNGKPAVVMSLEDFQSYEEIAYLMANPENAGRLDEAVSEVRIEKTLQSGIESIRHRLIAAENSGFTEMTMDEIWEEARQDGQISV